MATYTDAIARPQIFGMTHAVAKFAADVRLRYARHHAFTQTVKELSQLTDAELNDIGVARGDIHDIATAAANAL